MKMEHIDVQTARIVISGSESCNAGSLSFTGQITLWDEQGIEVRFSPEEFWYAVAGKNATPTAAEAGQLLAESLSRWQTLKHLQELLQQNQGAPYIPQARLDPFIEAALERCPAKPTREKVEALAQVIDQTVDAVIELLRERGKVLAETKDSQQQVTSANEQENTSFHWTEEMVTQLTEAFKAAPAEGRTIDMRAKTIAREHGWPISKVRYKIYHLGLPQKQAEKREEIRLPDPVALHIPEQHEQAALIKTGNFVWDVRIDGQVQRWNLDYPYGSFPFKGGQTIIYRDRSYVLHLVGTSMLKATTSELPVLEAV